MKGQGETTREDRFEGKSERAKFGIWWYVVLSKMKLNDLREIF
jgi:hypothetical protein